MCGSTGKATRIGERVEGGEKTQTPIWFGLYNIYNCRNGVLYLALRGVSQSNLDLVVLQDTKFIYGVYTYRLHYSSEERRAVDKGVID